MRVTCLACFYVVIFIFSLSRVVNAQQKRESVTIVYPESSHARIIFGAEKISKALVEAGYKVQKIYPRDIASATKPLIIVGTLGDKLLRSLQPMGNGTFPGKEGFEIRSNQGRIIITGFDNSGALYGCIELVEKIKSAKRLPTNILFTDKPEMVLRGSCIGVQKPTYLPGRGVYEYPYTPETFPWLYDKTLWLRYLDSMVENRMNSLYLWNGHPFSSLVKLEDYPYALEVDEATFKKNEEMFSFLTTEADKRGIWVIQMFYNIIIPKPFAEKHNLKTQDRNRPIIPLIADYTRKSIAAFVEKYPNVGLMVALGEAMEGVGQDDVDWFTKTIIPGVKDGLKALGKTEEPPIVLRAHDTDAPSVMKEALPLYKNLYTEAKYNGEALTTYTPRGPWAELHRSLAQIGTVQIENVHILANLEPFRYGSADFIQKCVQAMHDVHKGNGLHLYPESSYWDWPYSADNAKPRLLQIDRDWIWYKAWSRYAWNCRRDRKNEVDYWSKIIGGKYGTNAANGSHILAAYEQTGEIAPKLLRRFGITDGNRQTLTLGELMTQLINPYRYGLFTLLYNSEGPEGEMLTEYAEKEWKKEKHVGETPIQIINEVKAHGKKSIEAIEKSSPFIKSNRDEFARIKNDMYIYNALANNYADKAETALWVLRYKYSNDLADLHKALPHLQRSFTAFKQLANLTKNTYLYANSMQTQQRKIPVGGDDGKMKTWVELLTVYEQELANFKRNIDSLKTPVKTSEPKKVYLQNAAVTAVSVSPLYQGADHLSAPPKSRGNELEYYSVRTGSSPFTDTATYIKDYAEELQNLLGLKMSKAIQLAQGTEIKFTNAKPVKVLVGFFNLKNPLLFLPAPQLEIDASANDYGQAEQKITNAMLISGMPPVNVHTYSFKGGTNTLKLGKGACLILGFVDEDQNIRPHDAGLIPGGVKKELDWLFE